jgi:fumarylpyruvate hydrolase
MIWDVRDIIAFCSQSVTLKAGDLIMTGTPAGVGAVTAGDVLEGGVENIGELKVTLS